jgi:hypothetical protein
MLDAPVSGGTERAASGELSVIAGGDAATFEACRDLFKAMGTNLFHVGGLGQGLAMKLVNNMLVQVNTVAVAEALVVGVKAGLDPQTIYDVVRVSTGTSYAFDKRVPRILARDFSPTGQRQPAGLPDGAGGRPRQGGRHGHRQGARTARRRPGREARRVESVRAVTLVRRAARRHRGRERSCRVAC